MDGYKKFGDISFFYEDANGWYVIDDLSNEKCFVIYAEEITKFEGVFEYILKEIIPKEHKNMGVS